MERFGENYVLRVRLSRFSRFPFWFRLAKFHLNLMILWSSLAPIFSYCRIDNNLRIYANRRNIYQD